MYLYLYILVLVYLYLNLYLWDHPINDRIEQVGWLPAPLPRAAACWRLLLLLQLRWLMGGGVRRGGRPQLGRGGVLRGGGGSPSLRSRWMGPLGSTKQGPTLPPQPLGPTKQGPTKQGPTKQSWRALACSRLIPGGRWEQVSHLHVLWLAPTSSLPTAARRRSGGSCWMRPPALIRQSWRGWRRSGCSGSSRSSSWAAAARTSHR